MGGNAFDVVVVGAGMAGHCAALAAAQAGARVLWLEKQSQPGGSTAMCGGALAFAGTDLQKAKGIQDSPELLEEDLMKAGKYRITLQLRARDTAPVVKQFVFWADRHGARCVPTDDNSALSNQPQAKRQSSKPLTQPRLKKKIPILFSLSSRKTSKRPWKPLWRGMRQIKA